MRTKKLILNSGVSLLLQMVTVICGFILPRLMLQAFGSEVNGAVSSITQFLGYITLLEAGVGGVTRAALYKPLASGDMDKVNGIINSTKRFFRSLSLIFIVYAVMLSVSFKYISGTSLDFLFIAALVLIISGANFSQYCFGMTYSIVLQADQSYYIVNTIQILTVIFNTVVSVVMIKLGCGIHAIKLINVCAYLFKPSIIYLVCKKRYKLDKKTKNDYTSIKQRWNGFGHHIAYYIHNNVDIMIATIILGLKSVSVYSIYFMIVAGIKNVVNVISGSSEATFGNMIAKDEKELLENRFTMLENLTSIIITVFFVVTGMLIFDFIEIYTTGINDTEYILYPFGILLVVSEALHSLKQNYHSLVLAAGHYKETQKGAFVEAGMNLFLSVICALTFGLEGIVLATIISTVYRMIDYVIYLKKNIIQRPVTVFIKRMVVNVGCVIISVFISLLIPFAKPQTYFDWVLKAIPIFMITFIITVGFNFVMYKDSTIQICLKLISLVKKGKENLSDHHKTNL